MYKKKIRIGIIGSSGFVGKNFVDQLKKLDNYEITLLENKTKNKETNNLKIIQGNVNNLLCLNKLLEMQDIILNLIHPEENAEKFATNLLMSCKLKRVKKLIHISSADVYGNQNKKIIYEDDICLPKTKYQRSKKNTEDIFLEPTVDGPIVLIIRPTIIIGDGGKNLLGFTNNVFNNNFLTNFCLKSIFYYRKTNLLSVHTLTDCIIFLCEKKINKNEIFNISDDEHPDNSYSYVFRLFENLYHKKKIINPVKLYLPVIFHILKLIKKSTLSTNVHYNSNKIIKAGFIKKNKFENDLKCFADKIILNN